MSVERESISPNRETKAEESKESQERLREIKEAGEKAKHENKDSIEEIRKSIEKTAVSGKDSTKVEHGERKPKTATYIDRDIKHDAYQSTLKDVRRQLRPTQKIASRVIHNPVVEAVSEVGSKTVARPSALLGAGIFALLSTTLTVIASRYYGFRYNFFVLIFSLVVGFIFGIIVELLLRAIRPSDKN